MIRDLGKWPKGRPGLAFFSVREEDIIFVMSGLVKKQLLVMPLRTYILPGTTELAFVQNSGSLLFGNIGIMDITTANKSFVHETYVRRSSFGQNNGDNNCPQSV